MNKNPFFNILLTLLKSVFSKKKKRKEKALYKRCENSYKKNQHEQNSINKTATPKCKCFVEKNSSGLWQFTNVYIICF